MQTSTSPFPFSLCLQGLSCLLGVSNSRESTNQTKHWYSLEIAEMV
ncbi:hypothetical protein HMPREF9999_00138 [Alloprevotella sp. oral taxon 473 str. F0040]|nr:hypothetical protein HMPREF9999_00138 [Alloprevotella sp. oral taxon 473 str. F0040]